MYSTSRSKVSPKKKYGSRGADLKGKLE